MDDRCRSTTWVNRIHHLVKVDGGGMLVGGCNTPCTGATAAGGAGVGVGDGRGGDDGGRGGSDAAEGSLETGRGRLGLGEKSERGEIEIERERDPHLRTAHSQTLTPSFPRTHSSPSLPHSLSHTPTYSPHSVHTLSQAPQI